MKKQRTNRTYSVFLLVTVAITIVGLIVFAALMSMADYGTEQRKIYQTWFFYSSYFGIAIATILGILWYFNARKKRKRNLSNLESDSKIGT